MPRVQPGRRLGELLRVRPRRVGLDAVGVAAAERRGRAPEPRVAARLDRAAGVADREGRPGPDHRVGLDPPQGDAERVAPLRAALPPVGQVELRRGRAGPVAARVGPRLAVEVVEVGDLPVRRPAGVDAQHLGAVARPGDVAVGVVPVELDRVVGTEALGERLVVEPRLLAVRRARQRQRAGQRQRQHRRDPEPRPQRQPLEPEEADGQRGQDEPEHDRPRPADRDDRRGDEDEQQREREELVAAGPVAPRPERQQGGEHAEQRAEQLEREARPRVRAAVGHLDARERLRPVREPGAQLVQPARLEQREREPRGGVRGDERRDRHAERQRAAEAAARVRPQDPDRGGDGDEHPEQRVPPREVDDHPLPLRARRAARAPRTRPAGPRRQAAARAGVAASGACSPAPSQGWHAAGAGRTTLIRGLGHGEALSLSSSCWRSSIRRILPVSVFGSPSVNSIRRG